jgi:NhaP-type Na+/H+ or K+/H+ antiporter
VTALPRIHVIVETEFAPAGTIRRVGNLQIVIAALFVSAAGLNALANWLDAPYPIPLALGGLVLGLLPGISNIHLNPNLVLLVFLPPLLYPSAFFSDLRHCGPTRESFP